MAVSPLDVSIWSSDLSTRYGWVNDAQSVKVIPRHLAIGAATVTVMNNHPMIPQLGLPGNRLLIKRGQTVMSGPIRSTTFDSSPGGVNTYTIESDERLLWALLGYPTPGAPVTAQTTASDIRTGMAETVLKGFLQANAGRLLVPVEFAPDLGRGTALNSVTVRMTPLSDTLLPLLTNSGIGLKIIQIEPTTAGGPDGHLLVDVYETKVYPLTLTEASGIVQSATGSTQGPTVTRTVVGGTGTGTGRIYNLQINVTAEGTWQDVIESFTDDSSDTSVTKLAAAGQSSLSDGAPSAGLSLTLSETGDFTFSDPDGLHLGDMVTVELNNGTKVTNEVLTEATLNWDTQTGFTSPFTVGDRSDDKTRLFVKQVVQGFRAVRRFLAAT